MAIPKRIQQAKGSWKGKSHLHLSYLPPDQCVSESTSEIHVHTDARSTFATIAYAWEHEGERQEGSMLLCMDDESKVVQIGWSDSWHQNSGVLHLVGAEVEAGAVKTKGTFPAGEETWGWNIAFDLTNDEFILTMEVVPPGEEAEWAVKASYQRN